MYLNLQGELKSDVGLLSVERSEKLTWLSQILLTEVHVPLPQ